MKATSYKGKTRQDLVKALLEKREALRKIRFGGAGTKTRNVREARETRKEVARIMTELNKQNG